MARALKLASLIDWRRRGAWEVAKLVASGLRQRLSDATVGFRTWDLEVQSKTRCEEVGFIAPVLSQQDQMSRDMSFDLHLEINSDAETPQRLHFWHSTIVSQSKTAIMNITY